MTRLAAMGCTPTSLAREPMWMGGFWLRLAKRAEVLRSEWSEVDGIATITALGEAM